MNRTKIEIDSLLDRTTEAIRSEAVDPTAVDAASARVRAKLASDAPASAPAVVVEHIRGCADIVSLIPAYLGGELSDARRLLLEDHMGECVPCRKALKAARTGEAPAAARPATPRAATRPRRTVPVRWAIAAGLVLAFGILPVGRYLNPFGGSLEAAGAQTLRAARGREDGRARAGGVALAVGDEPASAGQAAVAAVRRHRGVGGEAAAGGLHGGAARLETGLRVRDEDAERRERDAGDGDGKGADETGHVESP